MPWGRASRQARGYGAAHDRMRKLLMRTVILCEECTRKGKVSVGTIADHKVSKAKGGTDDRNNYQLLCDDCHTLKTQAESTRYGTAHPTWLKPSAIPLVIVTGPPGAGKTTYAAAEAARVAGGFVIDLDQIAHEQTGVHGHDQLRTADRSWLLIALHERNARLSRLSAAGRGACWLIVAAPTAAERAWWQATLAGEIVHLNPGMTTCIERVGPARAYAVRHWFEQAEQAWRGPVAAPTAKGNDRTGRPTDPRHPWNRPA